MESLLRDKADKKVANERFRTMINLLNKEVKEYNDEWEPKVLGNQDEDRIGLPEEGLLDLAHDDPSLKRFTPLPLSYLCGR